MATARALWIIEPGRAEIREEELPEPDPNEVRVETHYSGISRGTERLVFHGLVPASEHQRMRAPHQAGEFSGAVKYGYSNVGRIVSPGPRQGQLVFSLFPHQDQFNIAAQNAHAVPEGVDPQRAVMAANMETALNAIWDGQPTLGDRVTVIGAGLVGSLLAALLRNIPGVDLEVIDTQAAAERHITALDARFALPDSAHTNRDLVFHTSASESGLSQALSLLRPGGKIVELSWFGDRSVTLPLGADFHVKRLQLVSSQVGSVSPNKPGWSHQQRMALALRLLSSNSLDVLLGPEPSFEQLPDALPQLLGHEPLAGPAISVRYHASS